jgi:hypothetical protein
MSKISNLVINYQRFVSLPWLQNLAGKQRVWFAVYQPSEERRLRAQIQEFETTTLGANHRWRLEDITDAPAKWLANHEYRESYFLEPSALVNVEEELKTYIVSRLITACRAPEVDVNTVVAVIGIGSLFGFTHVSGIIARVEDSIKGRLLVFFPGEYERNLYRFMDARDGFNYMAVPITCSERFMI